MNNIKSIVELKDTEYGKDIYVMGSGKSLYYVSTSFFEDKILVGTNQVFKKFNCKYNLAHHKEIAQQILDSGNLLVTSEYDCCISGRGQNILNGTYYQYKHAEQRHTNKVDLSVFDMEGYLACCSTTIATSIHLAYYLGAKNIIVCGMDGASIDDEYYFNNYEDTSDVLTDAKINHINVTYNVALEIINHIRSTGVNVVGFNPFINMRFEGHKVV